MMQRRRNAGFTLLEVLIAMAILAVGILGTLEFLPRSLRFARVAAERRAISNRATWVLNQARVTGAENFYNARRRGMPMELASLYNLRAAAEAYATYQGYSTVFTEMRGAEEVFLQRVVWSAKMHDGRRETFVTYITAQ